MALQQDNSVDGRVVAWGLNGNYQAQVPGGLSGVVGIAAGYQHTVALKNDGTVVAWGINSGVMQVPIALTEVVGIAAGISYPVALKSGGTVVAWGGPQLWPNQRACGSKRSSGHRGRPQPHGGFEERWTGRPERGDGQGASRE
ncbi:MAG: hypothetical protein EXS36_14175 [Pedosphaera sp.]|nr:hypothetical protein [Pedosphaera sp.]